MRRGGTQLASVLTSLAVVGFQSSVAYASGGEFSETEAISTRFFTGALSSDNFGRAVASAGDVNGDGYDDIIVGANLNDAAGTDAGRAYIYFGGLSIDNGADIMLTGALSATILVVLSHLQGM